LPIISFDVADEIANDFGLIGSRHELEATVWVLPNSLNVFHL
jgi:hypothetical protein